MPKTEPSIKYPRPVRKGYRVVMEIEIHKDDVLKCNEDYKDEGRNYAKANYTEL